MTNTNSAETALKLFCGINIALGLFMFVPITVTTIALPFYADPLLLYLAIIFLGLAYMYLGFVTWRSRRSRPFWTLVGVNAFVTGGLLVGAVLKPEATFSDGGGLLFIAANGGAAWIAIQSRDRILERPRS